MGRTSLSDVSSVGDPLQQWNWDLLIPNMPGSSNSRPFTIKCQTASIPGFEIEKVDVPLHGVQIQYAGRAVYSHTFEVTVMETSDASTRSMLVAWKNQIRDIVNNVGNSKNSYGTNLQLVLYNDVPAVVRTINIYGAWISAVGDSTLDGAQSALVSYSVTFTYDYFDEA